MCRQTAGQLTKGHSWYKKITCHVDERSAIVLTDTSALTTYDLCICKSKNKYN